MYIYHKTEHPNQPGVDALFATEVSFVDKSSIGVGVKEADDIQGLLAAAQGLSVFINGEELPVSTGTAANGSTLQDFGFTNVESAVLAILRGLKNAGFAL